MKEPLAFDRRALLFRLSAFEWIGLSLLACFLAVALLGDFISPVDPRAVGLGPRMAPPSWQFIAGTDELGRDMFSRLLVGIKVSTLVGVSSALVATVIGTLVGALGGYFGGWVDTLLMRFTDGVQVVPRFFLAVVLAALFGAQLLVIVAALAALSWPIVARIVRGEFLVLKSRQFVEAARVTGQSDLNIMLFEILPNALPPIVVAGTVLVGESILIEAGLSYLGLGDPSQVSLGLMLFDAQPIMRLAPWASAYPGLALALLVLSINIVGDALNRLLDPRAGY